jgi:hypothetical protein
VQKFSLAYLIGHVEILKMVAEGEYIVINVQIVLMDAMEDIVLSPQDME